MYAAGIWKVVLQNIGLVLASGACILKDFGLSAACYFNTTTIKLCKSFIVKQMNKGVFGIFCHLGEWSFN